MGRENNRASPQRQSLFQMLVMLDEEAIEKLLMSKRRHEKRVQVVTHTAAKHPANHAPQSASSRRCTLNLRPKHVQGVDGYLFAHWHTDQPGQWPDDSRQATQEPAWQMRHDA